MRNKYTPLERVLLGWVCLQEFWHAGGCILKGFDLQALTESLELQCMCCDNERTDPIEKGAFGGVSPRVLTCCASWQCGVWRSICRVWGTVLHAGFEGGFTVLWRAWVWCSVFHRIRRLDWLHSAVQNSTVQNTFFERLRRLQWAGHQSERSIS